MKMTLLAAAIAAIVLAVDLNLPLGVAGAVPYVALVMVGAWSESIRRVYILATLASVLTVIGYIASPEGGVYWVVLTNRGLALFAIWVVAVLIAQRKSHEITLLDSERRFRSMVENAGDGIYIHDRYGKVFDVNKVACVQTGYTRDELISMNIAQLDAAIDFDKLRDKWDLGIADPAKYPVTIETAHRRKDGSIFPIEVRISLLPSKGGYLFVAMVRDIAERKKTKRELDFQKRAMDEHAVVSITDVNGNIILVNDKFCKISGFQREELLGHNHRMLKSNEHSDEFYKDLWDTITSGKVWRGEIKNAKKKGGFNWAYTSIVPFLNEKGEPFQYVAIRTDITERKQAELDALKAKKLANDANRAKSDFLSSMSHELRTPLNAILGFGQLLECDPIHPLSSDQEESVGQILKGGEHLLKLINEVLDLAKIESGQLSISIEPVSPNLIVDSCMTMASHMASKRGIEIDNQISASKLPKVMADRTRFKQVLLNLLSNAVKYNRENGRITISWERLGHDKLRFSVTDTGSGIPAKLYDELFQPFHRLGRESSDIEGTGIGLTITRELVNLMGGKINFESVEGEGTTFCFALPLADESQAEQQIIDVDALEVIPSVSFAAGETAKMIFYIEDNPANLKLMEKIISREPGLELVSAHTAEIGLAMIESDPPDLILMDINLSGMDGINAMGILQANDATRHIPVIAVSAAAMPRDIERGMNAGFRDYLTKPINVNKALAVIRDALSTPDQ